MGVFHDYVAAQMNPTQLETGRKQLLAEIGRARGTGVLTYAARLAPIPAPVRLPLGIGVEDILPFSDLVRDIKNDRVSVILETHGGIGEVGRQLVELLHDKFDYVEFIIPGTAKSTGTIMALGGHEILMGSSSALGPIDAQISQDGKAFSADAFIEGLDRIKAEVSASGNLNLAYIPILQRISPGEIQNALNALDFAKNTVTEWLVKYKFANWTRGESSGREITTEMKYARAEEIAGHLASQTRWKTHGRSITVKDLEDLRLKVFNYSKQDPALEDLIDRYYALLRLTFDASDVFKLFESESETYAQRFQVAVAQGPIQAQQVASANVKSICPVCKHNAEWQVNLQEGVPLKPGSKLLPLSGKAKCDQCGADIDLEPAIKDIERGLGIQLPRQEEKR